MFVTKLISFCIASIITLYLGHLIAGSYIVFGNIVNSSTTAILIAGTLIGVIVTLVEPIIKDFGVKLSNREVLIVYYIVNSLAIYLFARSPLSVNIGIGITGFWVALFMGLALNAVQYAVWLAVKGKEKGKG